MRDTVLERFAAQVRTRGDEVALASLVTGGAAADATLTWREWDWQSRGVAAALLRAGLMPGERVAVLAGNRPLWPVADIGILMAGLVSVGLYPTSAPAQVRDLLADAGARAVIVDRSEQLEKVLAARHMLPQLSLVVCEDLGAAELPPEWRTAGGGLAVVAWEPWRQGWADGDADEADRSAAVRARMEAVGPDDLANLVYTSGSTGVPKGARLTHRYLLASARSVQGSLGLTAADSSLSFLPYCHAAERVFGLYTRIHCGMRAVLVEDHTRLWTVARETSPSVFGGLPRFYEKACDALRAAERRAVGAEADAWATTLRLGRERRALRNAGESIPERLEQEWEHARRPVREEVARLFGSGLRLATSGGATLPLHVTEYLDAMGVTVLGAYGLTEHLCVAFNRPERHDLATSGPPMEGTELRLGGDGEVLVRRSALTFDGYLGQPAASADAFTTDGEWLRTGDLGEVDGRGFLRITGRVKELIALSTGKKVAPIPMEARLTEEPWIAQAVVHGEGRRFLSALLTLRRPLVEEWAAAEGLDRDYDALLQHPAVLARVQAAVDRANAVVSRTEQVRRFVLLPDELTAESGELTPTLKVRRSEIALRHAAELDALYDESYEELA